jgi:hypothetical protein
MLKPIVRSVVRPVVSGTVNPDNVYVGTIIWGGISYEVFTDPATGLRMRIGIRDGYQMTDEELLVGGFNGVEGVGWQNVDPVDLYSELLRNGAFDDSSIWGYVWTGWSIGAGKAYYDATHNAEHKGVIRQVLEEPLVVGAKYELKYTISGSNNMYLYFSGNSGVPWREYSATGFQHKADGEHTEILNCIWNGDTALYGHDYFEIQAAMNLDGTEYPNMDFYIDNISLKRLHDSYTTEYESILANLTGAEPSDVIKRKQDNFIRYLKGENLGGSNVGLIDVWSKLCCLIPYNAGFASASDALMWWNNPSRKALLSATPPVYTVGAGFMGGTNKYIDTDWNPTEDADSLFTQNSCSIGFLFNNHRTVVTGGGRNGLIDAALAGISLAPLSGDGITYNGLQSAVQTPAVATQVDYFWIMSRNSATQILVYKNKILSLGLDPVASTALLNGNVYCLAANILGTGAIYYSSDSIGLFFAGAKLNQADINILNDAVALLI